MNNEDINEMNEWLESQKYLPEFMRDFHKQKDIFKEMHYLYEHNGNTQGKPSWIDGHVYTIDWFLWYMGSHGYTLQKSRKSLQFKELP